MLKMFYKNIFLMKELFMYFMENLRLFRLNLETNPNKDKVLTLLLMIPITSIQILCKLILIKVSEA